MNPGTAVTSGSGNFFMPVLTGNTYFVMTNILLENFGEMVVS
jgi:hypothetical protein